MVPFRFACQRSGNCCRVPEGVVWVEEAELAPLAELQGMTVEAFRARFVRAVPDPAPAPGRVPGELRLALRDDDQRGGRCVFLDGSQHCSVYAARPQHCADFPFWPSVMESEDGFERARAVCPGIAVAVDEERRALAFAALEELYAELQREIEASHAVCIMRGVCCRFEEAGHELFATALEADYAAERLPDAPAPEAPGRCPYHVGGSCTAREGRPLGCRTYFCDTRTTDVLEEVHAEFLERVRAIERRFGYPAAYGRFPAMLRARGVGVGPAEGGDANGEAGR